MKMHQLVSKQWLPVSLDSAWDFFSTPENLDRITPDDLSFEIRSGVGERTFGGQIIVYRIRPIANIPMTWVTDIVQCVDKSHFIDEQRFGPYRFWHHLHRFSEHEGGVLMEDVLHFALPGGWAGELVAGSFVKSKVNGIFTHRGVVLQGLFPGAKSAEVSLRTL